MDTSFESPHATIGFVDKQTHLDYWADHPPATGPTALRLESDAMVQKAEGGRQKAEPETDAPGIPPMGGEA